MSQSASAGLITGTTPTVITAENADGDSRALAEWLAAAFVNTPAVRLFVCHRTVRVYADADAPERADESILRAAAEEGRPLGYALDAEGTDGKRDERHVVTLRYRPRRP